MATRHGGSSRGHVFTVLVIAVAIALASFSLWCIRLVTEVSSLRDEVATRVGWLERLQELQARATSGGLEPAEREAITAPLAAIVDEIESHPTTSLELRAASRSDDRVAAEPLARISRLVTRIRGETAEISRSLGERWSSINLLAAIALALATSTLALLVYVRFVLLRRAQRALTGLQAHLRDADRLVAVGTLAAGVAHEISNPLTYLLTSLQLARHEQDERERNSLLDDALAASERVHGIVRDLRSVAKPTRDDVASCNVETCLDAALTVARTELRRVAQLERSYGAVPPVWGSDARLGQLFLNLLINAAHAMAEVEGRDHVLSLVTRSTTEGMVEIEIRDTGAGIPPELMARVYEPFVTSKPLGQGTGLGLFVCHNIVASLDGEIDIETSPAGTAVHVRLPAAQHHELTNKEP